MPKFADDCLAAKSVPITEALGAIGVVVGALLAHGANVMPTLWYAKAMGGGRIITSLV